MPESLNKVCNGSLCAARLAKPLMRHASNGYAHGDSRGTGSTELKRLRHTCMGQCLYIGVSTLSSRQVGQILPHLSGQRMIWPQYLLADLEGLSQQGFRLSVPRLCQVESS